MNRTKERVRTSTGKTKEAVDGNIQEALEFHQEGLPDEGREIPGPRSYSSYIVEVAGSSQPSVPAIIVRE